ncbi:deoxyribonuclease-1-like 2 isoform X1 [Ovis aries]|uniref:deoxyribonuclease-1-like 2 isoform X1 n=2 Tax=Ovis aries TaxID=9940 RepID=UPI001C2EF063|nr:deoxyribonuclease-1-like 2 isoform X1 [Ovis aries]
MKSGLVCPTPGLRSHQAVSVPLRPPMGGPLTLLAALWALGAARAQALRIGAFNIQSFGDSKVSDPGCCGVIAQILAGYDVMLVQEVRDPDLSAVSALIEQINSVSKHEYSFVSSEPLGRDQYKEMYLFVYRKDTVSVVDTYQYPDAEDAFSREPFVVKFSAPGSAAKEFVLIPLHAAPHHAVAEIDALYDVYLDVIDKWGTDVSAPRPQGPASPPRPHPGRSRAPGLATESQTRLPPCPAGHPVSGRLQRRLQIREGAGLAGHPPAQQRGLQVAHPGQRRHHGGQLGLRLRPHRGLRLPPAQEPEASVSHRARLPGGIRPGPNSGPDHQ